MVGYFKHRFQLLYVSLIFGLFGLLTKLFYRPWIIENDINDFGISGYAPNFIATTSICIFASFFLKKDQIKIMIGCTVGVLVYEIEQVWTSRTFDYLDVIATVFGLGLAIIIFRIVNKNHKLDSSDNLIAEYKDIL